MVKILRLPESLLARILLSLYLGCEAVGLAGITEADVQSVPGSDSTTRVGSSKLKGQNVVRVGNRPENQDYIHTSQKRASLKEADAKQGRILL